MITRKQVLIGIAVLVAIGLITTLIILLTKPGGSGGGGPSPGPSPTPPGPPGTCPTQTSTARCKQNSTTPSPTSQCPPITTKEQKRKYKITLWHEGYRPSDVSTWNTDQIKQYWKEMVDFCVYRSIDKCLVYIPLDSMENIRNVGNPDFFVENFMSVAGQYNLSVGLLSPLDYTLMYAQYYHEKNPDCYIRGGFARDNVDAMEGTDYSNSLSNLEYKYLPKGSNGIDGAKQVEAGFCPYDEKTGKTITPKDNPCDYGCPNQIEQLVQFAADVNNKCAAKNICSRVRWFAIDGEDIGAYVVSDKDKDSTKGFFAQFWYAMVTILGPTIGLSGDDIKLPITDKAKAQLSTGQAHGYGDSATGDGTNSAYPELYWISPGKDTTPASLGYSNEISRASGLIKWKPSSLTYPTENKCQDGEECNWQNPDLNLSHAYNPLCDQNEKDGCKIQCKGCKTIDDSRSGTTGDGCAKMCADSIKDKGKCYEHNGNCQSSSDDFSGCMAGGQGGGCLGCTPCVDTTLNNYGDVATLYMKYLNQPQALLNALDPYYSGIKSINQQGKGDGTIPLFSIEHSHEFCQDVKDCGLPQGASGQLPWDKYEKALNWPASASPKYNSNGCAQKKYQLLISNGETDDNCGTFPGFGMWSWEAFEQFLDLFTTKYNINEVGIYEWAFVPPNWQKSS